MAIKLRKSEKMFRILNLLAVLDVTTYYTSCYAIGLSIRWPYVAKIWTDYEILVISLKIYIKAS